MYPKVDGQEGSGTLKKKKKAMVQLQNSLTYLHWRNLMNTKN